MAFEILSFWVRLFSLPILHIFLELPVIHLSILLSQQALAISRSLRKISHVGVAVRPSVFPVSVGFSILVLSMILIPVLKFFFPSAVLQGVFEISSVNGATFVIVAPLAILQVILPLPFVVVSLNRFPYTETILLAGTPLPLITLPVSPDELPTAVSFAHLVETLIDAIFVLLETFLFEVIYEFSLEELFFSDKHSFALHLTVDEPASEDGLVCCHYLDIRITNELLEVESGVKRSICHQKRV